MTPEQRTLWLEARRSGVGASDVPAICGLAPWSDAHPLAVYLDKIGQLPPRTAPQLRAGQLLEPVVARLYEESAGVRLVEPDPLPLSRHPDYPHFFASPDRFVVDAPGEAVEIKTASSGEGWGAPGTDEVPPYYLAQVQWQLYCLPVLRVVRVVVLVAGNDLREYAVTPHPELQAELADRAAAFWEQVQRRQPPAIDAAHPAAGRLLDLLHRPIPGVEIQGDDATAAAVDYYRDLGGQISALQKERDAIRAALVARMGDASTLTLADGRRVVRHVVAVRGYTVDPREEVRLNVRNPKRSKETSADDQSQIV